MNALHGQLTAAIDARDTEQVAKLLRGVPEPQRRLASMPILDRVQAAPGWARDLQALTVAALGVAQSAVQAAAVIAHLDISDVAAAASEVLAERRPRWLEDFARRILRPGCALNGGWRLARMLIRAGLVSKPDMPEYITFLPHALGGTFASDPPLRQALLDDPALLDDEIFQLFAVEGASSSMHTIDGYVEDRRWLPGGPPPPPKSQLAPRTWRVTLKRLCDDGHLDRGRILDSCLGALVSDFRPGELIWYARFHGELAPSSDEVAARSPTYLRLLASTTASVVTLAQRAIEPLASAGRLDPAALIGASAPVLHRAEKKHVLAQLRLLEITVSCHPAFSAPAAEAAAAALTHKRADVAETALTLIGRHWQQLSESARTRIASAANEIVPSLRQAAATVLGLPAAQRAPQPSLPAVPHAEAPARLTGLHDLAETAATLIADPWDPRLVEQLLDGLARFCDDYQALAAALKPVASRVTQHEDVPQLRVLSWLVRPDPPAKERRRDFRKGYGVPVEPFWDNQRSVGTSPGAVLGVRLHEIYGWFWRGEPAPLLAFPDTVTGHVDPSRIAAQLARLEEHGRQPGPADLLQTLLRLPRQPHPGARRAAAALTSPAGRLLATTLDTGGLPDPHPTARYDGASSAVALTAPPGIGQWGQTVSSIWDLPDPITAAAAWYREAAQLRVWAWALPSHRDVAVAHALPILNGIVHPGRIHGPIAEFISQLPDLDGPAGPATGIALCYALAAHHPEHRAAGADAIIGFAHTGDLDSAAFGETVATLTGDHALILGRICDGFEHAATSGAQSLIWHVTRAALPHLLTAPPRDCHRLLAIAADCAAHLGARDQISGLPATAASTKPSRLTVEARRLQAILTH